MLYVHEVVMIFVPAAVGAENDRRAFVFLAVEPAYHRKKYRVDIDNASDDDLMAQPETRSITQHEKCDAIQIFIPIHRRMKQDPVEHPIFIIFPKPISP